MSIPLFNDSESDMCPSDNNSIVEHLEKSDEQNIITQTLERNLKQAYTIDTDDLYSSPEHEEETPQAPKLTNLSTLFRPATLEDLIDDIVYASVFDPKNIEIPVVSMAMHFARAKGYDEIKKRNIKNEIIGQIQSKHLAQSQYDVVKLVIDKHI